MDNGLISSPRLDSLNEDLDILTGLFYWEGARKIFENKVGMVCQPCLTVVRQSEVVYMRRMKGGGVPTGQVNGRDRSAQTMDQKWRLYLWRPTDRPSTAGDGTPSGRMYRLRQRAYRYTGYPS